MNITRLSSFGLAAVLLAACAAPKAKRVPPPPVAPPPAAHASAASSSSAAAAAAEVPTSPKGTLHRVYGVVVSVDLDARKVTVKDKRGVSRTFVVASDASLTKGGDDAKIALADVKADDHVTLRCGKDVAASVHVKVAPSSTTSVAKNK